MQGNTRNSRADEILLFTKIATGVNHNVTSPILLGGQSTTPAQLVAVFTDAVQASTDLDAARLVYQQKLKAQQAAFATAYTTELTLKSYVYGVYGKDNPVVTQFGFTVAKAGVKSVQVKAEASLKSAATRVARHTMGPKQKAGIHGTVPPVVPATEPVTVGAVVVGTTPSAAK